MNAGAERGREMTNYLADDEYRHTGFQLVDDKYPMSVRNSNGSMTIARHSRDCPPDQVSYLCEMVGRRFQFRAAFSHALSRFCEIVRVQADDLAKAMSFRSTSVADSELLGAFLAISPAINDLTRLFKGDRFGPFHQTFEVFLLSPDGEVAKRLSEGTTKLRPQGWKSGDQLWVVDVIAPFGGAEEMVRELKAKVFPGNELRYQRLGHDGKRECLFLRGSAIEPREEDLK